MGTVKYTGPVASFHCPTEATIRSLKVHFSPKQEGSGDPSPENVRPIEGWDGVEVYKAGKNLFNPETVTMNMEIGSDGNPLATGSSNRWCITDFIPVKPNTTYIAKALLTAGSGRSAVYDINKEKVSTKMEVLGADAETVISTGSTGHYVRLTVRIADGLNTTFEESSSATAYEPYHGSTTNYEFGVLGKNKFNWNVPSSESSPASSDATTAREFTLDTYVIGMSVNNYYRQNYANWVLNPSVENGVISFSSGGASGYGIAFPLKLAAGQTYFLSGTGNGAVGATYYNEDGELISYQNNRLNKTITVPDNAATTLIGFYANTSNTDFTFSNIQLELGSSATTYEPYNPNKTVYGGWVDLITGEVQETHGLKTFNGSEQQWVWTQSNNGIPYIAIDSMKSGTWYSDSYTICDTAIKVNTSSSGALQCLIGYNNKRIYFYNTTTVIPNISNLDDFTSWLSTNNITITYPLETPNIYYLAPIEMQTFLSTNNVWSNADYVEVEYDLHETQNILARKQFIVANQPHVVKPAAAPLQSFTTDMAAPLKECKVGFKPIQDLHGYDKPWIGGSGKNLFNINATEQNPSDTATANTTLRIFTAGTYAVGTSWSNWWQPSQITSYSINNNILTIQNNNVYGIGFAFKLTPESTYTISATSTNGGINVSYYDANGNYITTTSSNILNTAFTVPAEADITLLTFYSRVASEAATFTNIQLEEGSAATTYEPWENVCPISGWTGVRVFQTGKNLMSDNHVLVEAQFKNVDGNYEIGTANIYEILSIDVPKNTSLHIHKEIAAGSELGLGNEIAYYGAPAIRIGSMTNYYNRDFNTGNYPYTYLMIRKDSTINDSDKQWQIEVGNVATTYEAPKGTTNTVFNWSSVGTIYGGYVNLITGEVWKTYHEINITELGTYRTLSINKNNNTQVSWFLVNHLNAPEATAYVAYSRDGYCSCAPFFVNNYYWDSKCQVNNSTVDLVIEEELTVEEVDNWIKAHAPIQIVYPLKTPELVTTLSPTTLKTLRGTNNIWASNGGDNIEIAYWKH